ncbi:helix-hairpin-helix domain-containing protein [bacterium SCSIO 12741]|nr:helix-hairpin-helix domain-containing protein [bacterium SCSIO 12741]
MKNLLPKKLRSSFLTALLLLVFSGLHAQKNRSEQAINLVEERIEYLTQSLEISDADFTTLFDDLYFYYENPLNLNEATREELNQLHILNDFQINNLLRYLDEYGSMATVYELTRVEGFDPKAIQMILPFIQVTPKKEKGQFNWKLVPKYGKHEVVMRYTRVFPESVGYQPVADSVLEENPNARYLGNPDRYYFRYRFQYRQKISAGFTAEKDPGEEFFTGTQKRGFDFYSAHVFVRDIGVIKRLAIGDYHFQFGQGVTFWSGFGFRKTPAQTVEVQRYAQVFRPYTSTDENNYLRGAATTVALGPVEISAFYSNKGIDGNLGDRDTLSAEEAASFTSFQTSGLHRTPSEIEDRKAIREIIYGGALEYKFKFGQLGVTAVRSEYSPTLNRDLQLYQLFEFNNDQNTVAGLNYKFVLNRFTLFGEEAISENGGYALLNGAVMNLDQRFKMSALHRYYSPDYQSLYSEAFGERSGVRNESGIYLGAEFYPIRRFSVHAFADFYTFPWISYRTDAPGRGNEYSTQVVFRPARKIEFLFLYRHETRSKNYNPQEAAINQVKDERNNRYRIQMTADANSWLTLRTRLEVKDYKLGNDGTKYGYLFYQDLYFYALENKLALKLRYALFDTDDYDARIYAYENDIRYQFIVPAFSERGSRIYLTGSYKFTDWATFYLKVGQTYLSSRDYFGSGKDLIEQDTRTDLKAQLILKF